MQPLADRLSEKIHTLTGDQLAELERFVKALETGQRLDQRLAFTQVSEASFHRVWNNPEDEVYDAL